MARGVSTGREVRARRGWRFRHPFLFAVGLFLLMFGGGTALFAPWAFYLGGHFHWVPAWAGVASFSGPDGRYQLYVWVKPWPQGKGIHLDTSLNGNATLCTPRGERIYMKVSAGMDRHLPTDTVGQRINLSAYERNAPYKFWASVSKPGGARLALKGVWGEGKMDATGTVKPGGGAAPVNFAGSLVEMGLWSAPACAR